jgi:hypothetical protein
MVLHRPVELARGYRTSGLWYSDSERSEAGSEYMHSLLADSFTGKYGVDGFLCKFHGSHQLPYSDLSPLSCFIFVSRNHVDHIKPDSQEGEPTLENLRTLCADCNQGRPNIQTPTETSRNILARIRKLPRAEQREVYRVLKRSFPAEVAVVPVAEGKKDDPPAE